MEQGDGGLSRRLFRDRQASGFAVLMSQTIVFLFGGGFFAVAGCSWAWA